MYPVKLIPAVKDYLWGGQQMKELYGFEGGEILAEAWMLSCNPAGESLIAEGPLAGKSLREVLFAEAEGALGKKTPMSVYFPLLIKFIDAKQALSIQVHPDDAYAIANEGGFGKTEMWYILDAAEDSFLYCGFEKQVDKDELRARIKDNTVTEVLRRVSVKKGDTLFIPAGTVHAIGAGILIAEVQQNSNSTYRVYDFGRVGPDGKERELHIDKALDVIRPEFGQDGISHPQDIAIAGGKSARLAECQYFTVDRVTVDSAVHMECGEDSFDSLLFVEGKGRILFLDAKDVDDGELSVKTGDSVFVPAGSGRYVVEGDCCFLLSRV